MTTLIIIYFTLIILLFLILLSVKYLDEIIDFIGLSNWADNKEDELRKKHIKNGGAMLK